jgi:putative ABC transport system permease protein
MSIETLLFDLRYAMRALRRRRSFTAIAVLTVALGIGAATAMFAIVDNVLLRPLKHKDSDRLVSVWGVVAGVKDVVVGFPWNRFTVSMEDYEDWRRQQTVFEETAIFATKRNVRYSGTDQTRVVNTARASANLLTMLGTRFFQGRAFAAGESDAVVVAYEFWNTELGADRNAIGRTITLDKKPATIVGILPPHFVFAGYGANTGPTPEVWQPVKAADYATAEARGEPDFEIIARVRTGVPLLDAERETDRIFRNLRFALLDVLPTLDKTHGARLESRRDVETSEARTPLFIMLMASGLLLLIACGNIANLLLGEARGREHEIAMRSAVGASRPRIVRQLVVESLLISAMGSLLGFFTAFVALRGVVWLAPAGLPRINEIILDARILALMSIVSAGAGILFGLAPAISLARTDLIEALKSRGEHRGSSRNRSQGLIVIAEISICFVLLVGAGLLVQTMIRLSKVNPGINPDKLLAMQISLPSDGYPGAQIRSAYERMFTEFASLPGVVGVTGAGAAPFQDFRAVTPVTIDGKPAVIESRDIWPNYFDVIGGRIINGRAFSVRDLSGDSKVLIVNRTMARQFWPNSNPIGRQVDYPGGSKATVVGVSEDASQLGLGVSPPAMFYEPMTSNPTFTALIRSTQDPMSVIADIRTRIRSMDANIAINWAERMENLVRGSYAEQRYRALLIVLFALSAVCLAVVGLYGVMSRFVASSNREIGIRLAIGAQPRKVLALVIGRGFILTVAGMSIGAVGAGLSTSVLSKYLFDVNPTDAPTFAGVAVLLAATSVMAAYVPARRASRIDPAQCLRAD